MQSVCQLAGLTACLLAVAVAAEGTQPRPPRIGFIAMRGKRDASHLLGAEQLPARQRRFSYPLSRLLRLGGLYGDVYARADRAPAGFTGLRGKKVYSGFSGLRGKKVYSGFSGLRGKRPSAAGRDKKVPQGFAGARGKKLGVAAFEQLRRVAGGAADKRAPSGAFLGLRGRRLELE